MNAFPPRLIEIIDDFQMCEGNEKIELLVQYSENMPELPIHLQGPPQEMQQVEECMTPVFVKSELIDGGMQFYFDVPPESPTIRGFAAILAEGMNGSTPDEILNTPNDFYLQMGLGHVLSMQRLNGMAAILAHMKRLATQAAPGSF